MQPSDNGQQGVILGADTLQALLHSLDSINTHVGAIRLMVSSLMSDGAADLRDLMVLEKTNRLAEEHADTAYSVLANHTPAPYMRLAQELARRQGLAYLSTPSHPLEPVAQPSPTEV